MLLVIATNPAFYLDGGKDVLLKRTTSIKEEQTGQEDNEEISKNPMPTEDA